MEQSMSCFMLTKAFVVIITWASWGIRTSCPLSVCCLGHFASSLCLLCYQKPPACSSFNSSYKRPLIMEIRHVLSVMEIFFSSQLNDIGDLRQTIPWTLQVEIPAERFLKNYRFPWPLLPNCAIWEISSWLSVLFLSIRMDGPPDTASV